MIQLLLYLSIPLRKGKINLSAIRVISQRTGLGFFFNQVFLLERINEHAPKKVTTCWVKRSNFNRYLRRMWVSLKKKKEFSNKEKIAVRIFNRLPL